MKVISIKSPWAELIASGEKRIENRTWKTKWRGPILIHRSGKNGAIVACADLISIMTPQDARGFYPEQSGYIEGPWCWVLFNIQKLENEIPTRGKLGVWEYPI